MIVLEKKPEMQLVLPSTFLGIWALHFCSQNEKTLVHFSDGLREHCTYHLDSLERPRSVTGMIRIGATVRTLPYFRLVQTCQRSPSCFPITSPYNLKAWLAHTVVAHIVVFSQKHARCLLILNCNKFSCSVMFNQPHLLIFSTLGCKRPRNK